MAQIRETLTLEDRFSAAFTNYIKISERASASTREVQTAMKQVQQHAKVLASAYDVATASARAQTAQTNATASAQRAAAQAARTAKQATDQLTQSQKEAAESTSGLIGKLKGLTGAYMGVQGAAAVLNLSDTMAQTDARLRLMAGSAEAAAQAQNQIYSAALRSRSAYADTANMVAKLGILAGGAFSDVNEIVAFTEQINKQMKLSGTTAEAARGAMEQLTQAMGAGVLRGEELNSVIYGTPMIAQTIAKYMGVSVGEMRNLASEGKVTSQVVKNALAWAAAETDAAFGQMPMTWAEVWTQFQTVALWSLRPVLSGINWLANNIEIIGPLILGAAGAFVVFQVAANWTRIASAATAAYSFVVNLLSIGYGVLTGNTAAASAATMVFNSALLASPVTWVAMGTMLLVGALYAGVAAFNHFSGSSVSATGIIAGAFLVLGAHLLNTFIIPTQNQFAAFANFTGNLFNDPVAAVKVLFLDMATSVLGYISNLAHGIEDLINNIPWMSVNLTSGIDNVYNKVKDASQRVKDASEWKEYVKAWDYVDYSAAFTKGYSAGSSFNLFGGTANIAGNAAATVVPTYDQISNQLTNIGDSVKGIEKTVSMSDEDLKSLVDMAERRYVNNINLTSQTPVINITGQNTGNTAADRQNLANVLRDILIEQVASGSTRSTARAFSG